MRIAIAGMHHESNTFNPVVTGQSEFLYYKGNEIYDNLDSYASARGIFECLTPIGYELLPVAFARAVPNGVVSKDFYLAFKAELLRRLASLGKIDGIVFALHGSMTVEEIGDAEGDLLEAVRAIEPGVPVTASLDMHATITDKMLRNADGFVGYKTAPHVDMYETGFAAARLMDFCLRTRRPLKMVSYRVPLLIAGEQTETSSQPTASLIGLLKEAEASGEVLSASYLLGFPWADTETNGVTALAVTLDDIGAAETAARRLAAAFWKKRHEFAFHTEAYTADEALERAFTSPRYPVFVSDSGDNPTAGSTGDSPHLLRRLLNHAGFACFDGRICYAGFCDEETVRLCKGKVGQRVHIDLGGKLDRAHGKPIGLDVDVLAEVAAWGPYKSDLVAVRTGKIDIVVAQKHIGFGDEIDYWRALGLDPASYPLVCLKLGYLTEIYYPYKPRSILALSEGCSNEILSGLPFRKISRPIFPLDDGFSYEL